MNNKITPEQYGQAWQAYKRGEMSLEQWTSFAVKMWRQTMEESKDILKRLANR